ncbi:hypothetical protein LTS18_008531 [Coniosporium uncinatum]|uniref:Uncharacterized protein n=1 Tax=Coniosporium uncinatum TaxID=93489 RepID=A0ACC3D1K4_9PEZI|nr:hypothetical protein LTS18_008531 [Coniosporium uncinatum]
MRFSTITALALSGASISNGLSIPADVKSISIRDTANAATSFFTERDSASHELERRKGGGGKGGGGSSSSGGSSSGGARTGGTSNTGGATSAGSGVRPSYGGGRYYGGGATAPYAAGRASPRGVAPYLIGGAALGVLPGIWLYGAYAYPYSHPYRFYNQSATNATNPNGTNQTKPVQCLCGQYQACGCEENDDSSYLDDLVGNGSYAALNKSVVNVADVNGTSQIFINGTLPNGTTAAGGQDDVTSAASPMIENGMQLAGYWVVAATVIATVYGF